MHLPETNESRVIEQIYYSSKENKVVELLNTQADIYEYLAGIGEDDSVGVTLGKKYSLLIEEVNDCLRIANSVADRVEVKYDPSLGEQLLERIASRI